jgi:hypothetical protein
VSPALHAPDWRVVLFYVVAQVVVIGLVVLKEWKR